MDLEDEIARTAVHEAGHAVATDRLGLCLRRIEWVVDDYEDRAETIVGPTTIASGTSEEVGRTAHEARAILAVSGAVAVALAVGCSTALDHLDFGGRCLDADTARTRVELALGTEDADLVRARTADLVEIAAELLDTPESRSQVMAIATALADRRRQSPRGLVLMESHELDDILGR